MPKPKAGLRVSQVNVSHTLAPARSAHLSSVQGDTLQRCPFQRARYLAPAGVTATAGTLSSVRMHLRQCVSTDEEHAFEANLPFIFASHALLYTTEQTATARTGILSGETKPNVLQPSARTQCMGADQS